MRKESFEKLQLHAEILKKQKISEITSSRNKIHDFIIETDELYLDFNRNFLTHESLNLMDEYLNAIEFARFRDFLYSGGILNSTENRSADHIALRNTHTNLYRGKPEISEEIRNSLHRIERFTEQVHNREKGSHLIGDIDFVVHIGIGGSDLGPRMIVDALEEFKSEKAPEILFISNVDPYEIRRVLKKIRLSNTIFINVSKSFTTPETLKITKAFIHELEKAGLDPINHLLAITANPEATRMLPVHPDNCFYFPNSIGGRYSLWSVIGLVISLFLGYEGFRKLLNGASRMDEHFLNQPFRRNIPVIFAFLEFMYISFFHSHFHSINFYTERLRLFPMYLQQLEMESNGKSVSLENKKINHYTACALFGGTGTPCQHSYFQALHQGKHFFHADFVGLKQAPDQNLFEKHYDFLFSNMMAQAETMMLGYHNSPEETIPVYKEIEGNKPSNILLLKQWNPEILGNLIAVFEHKTFTLGRLWNINSFDQWGVERGKKICDHILNTLDNPSESESLDQVTKNNLAYYKSKK